jgi:uncharacterized protein YggT (Ycf19 family)
MLTDILVSILNVYSIGLLLYCILSWVHVGRTFKKFLAKFYEPILTPIRAKLPSSGIDFSPFILYIIIVIIARCL